MRKGARGAVAAAILTLIPVIGLVRQSSPALASSHREAPMIAEDPLADNTDVYAFVSPDAQTTVTLLANYVPFQNPAGGPNFYRFGDDVQYDIHVDNVGDGKDHLIFRYNFTTTTVDPNTFLYNTGPFSYSGPDGTGTYANWNRPQTYTLSMLTDNGAGGFTTTVLGRNLTTPPDNVGPRSVGSAANYHTLANHAIATLTAGNNTVKSFAGQRAEQFFLDLGGIFDLLGVAQPFGTAAPDSTAGINVNTLALQVPKALLRTDNCGESGNGQPQCVVGVWATSSRAATTVIGSDGSRTSTGTEVQVSRLGNPLVNEVVIPLGQKDKFNASQPVNDGSNGFAANVTQPETAALLNAIFNAGAPTTNRNDLVSVFLTGITGLNKVTTASNTTPTAAEYLRLNYDIAPTHTDPNAVNRLGVLGGENDGFPNGRRLGDDVVDIELQAVDGILCQQGGALQGSNPPCRSGSVPSALGDGVNKPDVPFQTTFPYIADPHGPSD